MNVFFFVFVLAAIFAHYFHDCVGGLLGSVPFARIKSGVWQKDTENICKGLTTTTLILICTIHEGVTGIHHCTIMVVR